MYAKIAMSMQADDKNLRHFLCIVHTVMLLVLVKITQVDA